MAILTSLIKVENLTINYDDFFYSILTFYQNSVKKKKIDDLNNFFKYLPKLEEIKKIVFSKKIHKKEFIPLKITLDIYENYLLQDSYSFINNKDIILFLEISEYFYKNITRDEDTFEMFTSLINEMEKTSNIIFEMKCIIARKRKIYLSHLKTIYNDFLSISKGLNQKLFIL